MAAQVLDTSIYRLSCPESGYQVARVKVMEAEAAPFTPSGGDWIAGDDKRGVLASMRSRRDGRDRGDLVAVLLVETKFLHDPDALGERLAIEVAQGLA